ncbi:hypothetical protein IC582_010863 [Cucumis melo]
MNRNRSVINFVFCGLVLALSSDLSLVRKVGSLQSLYLFFLIISTRLVQLIYLISY